MAQPPAPEQKVSLDAIDIGVALVQAKGKPDARDKLERTQIETESLHLQNRLIKARLKSAKADRALRKQYAGRILRYLEWYSAVVGIFVLLAGFKPSSFTIEPTVLSTLVGSTAIAAIGLVGFIARGLFRPVQSENSEK